MRYGTVQVPVQYMTGQFSFRTDAVNPYSMAEQTDKTRIVGRLSGTSGARQIPSSALQSCCCSICGDKVEFREQGHRLSTSPGVVFLEEALLREDPFSSQGRGLPLQVTIR